MSLHNISMVKGDTYEDFGPEELTRIIIRLRDDWEVLEAEWEAVRAALEAQGLTQTRMIFGQLTGPVNALDFAYRGYQHAREVITHDLNLAENALHRIMTNNGAELS